MNVVNDNFSWTDPNYKKLVNRINKSRKKLTTETIDLQNYRKNLLNKGDSIGIKIRCSIKIVQ